MNLPPIYFIAGLPRSGSTLLTNILAQNPDCYTTPTSGIIDMLVNVRNHWDQNQAFKAMDRSLSEQIKQRIMQDMLQDYFPSLFSLSVLIKTVSGVNFWKWPRP